MMTTRAAKDSRTTMLIWAALLILAVGGLAVWLSQLVNGMGGMGLSQQTTWGAYIAGFFAAAGIGAGILVLVGLSEFRPILDKADCSLLLEIAVACFIVAGLLISMDLGSLGNVWRIAFSGRFESPVVWDFYGLAVSLIVSVIYWWQIRKSGEERPQQIRGIIAVVVGIALVIIELWLLAAQASHPYWRTLPSLLSFPVVAALGAAAFAALIAKPASASVTKRWLAVCLGLSLVNLLVDVLISASSGDARTNREFQMMISGDASGLFWLYTLFGLIVPLLLVLVKQPSRVPVSVAVILAIAGVFVEKLLLLAVGQSEPWLPLATDSYAPAWGEILGVIGVVAIGGLVYLIVNRLTANKSTSL